MADAADELPKQSVNFSSRSRLPVELLTLVLEAALPPIISGCPGDPWRTFESRKQDSRWDTLVPLLLTSKTFASIILDRILCMHLSHSDDDETTYIDPCRDTLLVEDMKLPQIQATERWDPANTFNYCDALPNRKILSVSDDPWHIPCRLLPHSMRPGYLRGIDDPLFDELSLSAKLIIPELPLIRELDLVVVRARWGWTDDDIAIDSSDSSETSSDDDDDEYPADIYGVAFRNFVNKGIVEARPLEMHDIEEFHNVADSRYEIHTRRRLSRVREARTESMVIIRTWIIQGEYVSPDSGDSSWFPVIAPELDEEVPRLLQNFWKYVCLAPHMVTIDEEIKAKIVGGTTE